MAGSGAIPVFQGFGASKVRAVAGLYLAESLILSGAGDGDDLMTGRDMTGGFPADLGN